MIKIFTDNIEDEALKQVDNIRKHPIFRDETIRIMPDVHAGTGCVIGFTATNSSKKIIPNLIGVDIGCGMLMVKLGNVDFDLELLDSYIDSNIPSGHNINEGILSNNIDLLSEVKKVCNRIEQLEKLDYHYKSLGTLGGGNHFIEVSTDKENNKYLIIHSGSRNFGHRIASFYQNIAETKCDYENIDLRYLCGEDAIDYYSDMKIAQEFASENRIVIASRILQHLKIQPINTVETIHNYISEDNTIRKGAISAQKGEMVLIPINMRDGSILAKGKGNKDWNCSAPHGAGRLMSRNKAKKELSLNDFNNSMRGIYTTSVRETTLDEAPMAYKSIDSIIDNILDTVDIIDILKPIYNFKAH